MMHGAVLNTQLRLHSNLVELKDVACQTCLATDRFSHDEGVKYEEKAVTYGHIVTNKNKKKHKMDCDPA
jgi:hypothetical protein